MVGSGIERDAFNVPFLLNSDGSPWNEANSFLYHQIINKHVITRPTDDMQRRAARLLKYKIFTEDNGLHWLDFSGKRLTSRPTYRYYKYLVEDRGLSAHVINQYTSDIYRFYQFVSQYWYEIPMDRVDTTKAIRIYFSGVSGTRSVEKLKRSQTKSTPAAKKAPLGYVRDEGEILRPLTFKELKELKTIINGPQWSPIERLIILTSVLTGARKQTVLTLRLKTITKLFNQGPDKEGCYKIFAGPGTLIDTKNSKRNELIVPPELMEELYVYAMCEQAVKRRQKFQENYKKEHPGLKAINPEDVYLFLSDQGNCYYMAKDDPRYPIIKSPPRGQVVDALKRKILKSCSDNFPRDFYYHWLRATFALLIWDKHKGLLKAGKISDSELISIIQSRLNHKNRETTENYLKLFKKDEVKRVGQDLYENTLFPDLSDFRV